MGLTFSTVMFSMKIVFLLSGISVFLFLTMLKPMIFTVHSHILMPVCALPVLRSSEFCDTIQDISASSATTVPLPLSALAKADHLENLVQFSRSPITIRDIGETVMALDDILILVEGSTIERCNIIASGLKEIRSSGRTCSQQYLKYLAHIDSAVNIIILSDEHAIAVLDERPTFYNTWPFACHVIRSAFGTKLCSDDHQRISDAFTWSLDMFESTIHQLTQYNFAVDACIIHLESEVSSVAEVIGLELIGIEKEMGELLSYLWTRLGGYRSRVSQMQSRQDTLAQAGNLTKTMRKVLWDTRTELQSLQESADSLRMIAATPLLFPGPHHKAVLLRALSDGSKRLRTKIAGYKSPLAIEREK